MFSRTEDFPDDCEPTTTYNGQLRFTCSSIIVLEAYNLRKVERIVADGVEDQILKLVHSCKEILSQASHFPGRGLVERKVARIEECAEPVYWKMVIKKEVWTVRWKAWWLEDLSTRTMLCYEQAMAQEVLA